ncbi:stage III sporulation protein AE [Lentibacillus amyloliquefaciens]|uniref:Stage III sporulation protein AE n=1 Tax=Lentibacillus amyloliquefaciens TaxID=1472767 RepID=A0A0U3W4B5_9BACI|nr:stage III sporulation protein AE [Lentibacillus amyloliquefaciens]ALX48050.1 stage III sporulation protein AE [Lentibacillus amyloliquefaciens]
MKQYKWAAGTIIILLLLMGFTPVFAAEDQNEKTPEDIERQMLNDVQLDGIETHWETLVDDYGGFVPELEKTSIYEFVKDNGSFSIKNTLLGIAEFLLHELILNGKLLGTLLMLTLFSSILQTMHTAFEKSTVSKIAYYVVYIVLIYLVLNSFYLAVSYANDAIDTMSSFMIALLPLVLGIMATLGNVITVAFFHPIIIFLINVSGVLVSKFILPLLFLSALLLIVSSLNENYKVTNLANLFKQIGMGALGVFLTVFLGVMSVQGASSAVQDGVAMKTTKFITGNFIPVVGRTFTDATDTILSASLLLKNAVGIVGVVIILLAAIFPALKIFAIALIYKLAAAVLQPIGDGPVITTLDTISKYIVLILACLLAVTLMFFLSIVILVAASNITILLR